MTFEDYKFKWCARSEEGEWYTNYDHCVASSLSEAAEIIANKNGIDVSELEIYEDEV